MPAVGAPEIWNPSSVVPDSNYVGNSYTGTTLATNTLNISSAQPAVYYTASKLDQLS